MARIAALTCLINRERRDEGLRALDVSKRLFIAGWRHARDMRDHDYFDHRGRDGSTLTDRIQAAGYTKGHERDAWALGETLVWAPDATSDPTSLIAALMGSPPHRRVILDPRFRELGVGAVRGTPTEDPDGVTVTVNYGSLTSPASVREDPPRDHTPRKKRKPKGG